LLIDQHLTITLQRTNKLPTPLSAGLNVEKSRWGITFTQPQKAGLLSHNAALQRGHAQGLQFELPPKRFLVAGQGASVARHLHLVHHLLYNLQLNLYTTNRWFEGNVLLSSRSDTLGQVFDMVVFFNEHLMVDDLVQSRMLPLYPW
jgi:hypothetical protein